MDTYYTMMTSGQVHLDLAHNICMMTILLDQKMDIDTKTALVLQ